MDTIPALPDGGCVVNTAGAPRGTAALELGSPVRSGLGTAIPGALGSAPPAAPPLPAGAAASSCSCARPPGPSPPGSEPADPVPRFPAPGAPPLANDAAPAPLPSRAERRRGGKGSPGSGGRKRGPAVPVGMPGSGCPGAHCGPGPSAAAPAGAPGARGFQSDSDLRAPHGARGRSRHRALAPAWAP